MILIQPSGRALILVKAVPHLWQSIVRNQKLRRPVPAGTWVGKNLKWAKGGPGVLVKTWLPGLMASRLAGVDLIQVGTIQQSLALKSGQGRGPH